MEEVELNDYKKKVRETQVLIRNSMTNHKKVAKEIQMHMKKDKKTIEFYKEKIAKLNVEKEKYESRQHFNSDTTGRAGEIAYIRAQIEKERAEKTDFDEKIKEIKEDFLNIKNEMGGLNATEQLQDRYEKHIKILENRLDKANQKFNESILYDKKLREEIDKLRKERFFFEEIYKKMEKELEKLRKEISVNLEKAYDCYEKRDRNQEDFDKAKTEMMKKESEYAKTLADIANELNSKNLRKKSLGGKDRLLNPLDENLIDKDFRMYSAKFKSDNVDSQTKTQMERIENLDFKFKKLIEFTELTHVNDFCEKFETNAQKNFNLFLAISMISKEAKGLESEIKELEDDIRNIKMLKIGQSGLEKTSLLNELKSKTQKLGQKQEKYETEYKKNSEEFKHIKNGIETLHKTLECEKTTSQENILLTENGVNEGNVTIYLSEIEQRIKTIYRFFESEKANSDDFNPFKRGIEVADKRSKNPKQVAEDMKHVFASMGILIL
jgi:hypothetical protein